MEDPSSFSSSSSLRLLLSSAEEEIRSSLSDLRDRALGRDAAVFAAAAAPHASLSLLLLEEVLSSPAHSPADAAAAASDAAERAGGSFPVRLLPALCARVFGEAVRDEESWSYPPTGWLSRERRWRCPGGRDPVTALLAGLPDALGDDARPRCAFPATPNRGTSTTDSSWWGERRLVSRPDGRESRGRGGESTTTAAPSSVFVMLSPTEYYLTTFVHFAVARRTGDERDITTDDGRAANGPTATAGSAAPPPGRRLAPPPPRRPPHGDEVYLELLEKHYLPRLFPRRPVRSDARLDDDDDLYVDDDAVVPLRPDAVLFLRAAVEFWIDSPTRFSAVYHPPPVLARRALSRLVAHAAVAARGVGRTWETDVLADPLFAWLHRALSQAPLHDPRDDTFRDATEIWYRWCAPWRSSEESATSLWRWWTSCSDDQHHYDDDLWGPFVDAHRRFHTVLLAVLLRRVRELDVDDDVGLLRRVADAHLDAPSLTERLEPAFGEIVGPAVRDAAEELLRRPTTRWSRRTTRARRSEREEIVRRWRIALRDESVGASPTPAPASVRDGRPRRDADGHLAERERRLVADGATKCDPLEILRAAAATRRDDDRPDRVRAREVPLLLDGTRAASRWIQERFNVKVDLRFAADWRNALWIVATCVALWRWAW